MYCANCSEPLSEEMNFCPKCAYPINSNNSSSFNQSNNIQLRDIKNSKNVKIEQTIFSPNKQEIDVYYEILKKYGSFNKIRKNTILSMLPSGAGFIYYIFKTLKPLLNIGKLFEQNITNSTSTLIMTSVMLIFILQMFLLLRLNNLKKYDFVSLFRNSIFQINLYLMNDDIMKIRIKSICPKCQSELYPYTKFERDENKNIISEEALLICRKNRNHIFEFDHTKLKKK